MNEEVGQTKKFTKADYDKYNSPGVAIVSSLFTARNYTVQPFKENKDKKDLFVSKDGVTYKAEAELRSLQARRPVFTYVLNGVLYFEYDTVHALQRKQVDQWDFYCQCFYCFNFDTNEQTFAVATIHKSCLKDLKTSPVNCYQGDRAITKGENMGNVSITDTHLMFWSVLVGEGKWRNISVTNKGYAAVKSRFISSGLEWEDIG